MKDFLWITGEKLGYADEYTRNLKEEVVNLLMQADYKD